MAGKSEYSEEFKETAIKLAQAGDKSISQVSDELGLQKWQLYSWIKAAKKKAKRKSKSPAASKETAEKSAEQQLRELQKKYKELETENDILKKAAAYFAKNLL